MERLNEQPSGLFTGWRNDPRRTGTDRPNVPVTLGDLASSDGPSLAPVHGPDEPVPSLTGSGVLVTGGRNVGRIGHSPQVIGSQATSGTPTGWGDGPIDATALPATPTVVRRSRKGRTTFRPVGRRPQHKRTVGATSYVDPVADMAGNLASCAHPAEHGDTVARPNGLGWSVPPCTCALTESALVRIADTWLEHCDDWSQLRLIGDKVTHPSMTRSDRALVSRHDVETFTRPNQQLVSGDYRWAPNPGVASVSVHNEDLGGWFGMSELGNGRAIRANETRMPRRAARTTIPAANRLHTAGQLRKHAIAELGRVRIADVALWARMRSEARLIGRQTAEGTALVTFTDRGWFVGNGSEVVVGRKAATSPATTDAGATPLSIVRAMTVGETLHGITRVSDGRWMHGSTELTPAAAAYKVKRALATAQ